MSLPGVDTQLLSTCWLLCVQPQVCHSQRSKRKLKHLFHTQEKCITAALDCVRREFGTAEQECEDPYEYIQAGIHNLQKLIKDRLDKDYVSISLHFVDKPLDKNKQNLLK